MVELCLFKVARIDSKVIQELIYRIIDLSSPIAVEILKSEISTEEFDRITAATNIEPTVLADYAVELMNSLQNSTLSTSFIRESLYKNGFKRDFDFILHFDAAFIEVITRYL